MSYQKLRPRNAIFSAWLGALLCISAPTLTYAQNVRVGLQCGAYSTYGSIKDLCSSTYLTDNAPDSTYSSGYATGTVVSDAGNYSTSREPNLSSNDPSYEYVQGGASAFVRADYGSLGVSTIANITGTFNGGAYYQIVSSAEASFVDKIYVSTTNGVGTLSISGYLDVSDLYFSSSSSYYGFSGGGENFLRLAINTNTGSTYSAGNPSPNWNGNTLKTGRNYFSFETEVIGGQELVLAATLSASTSVVTGSSISPQYGLPIEDALTITESGKISSLNSLHLFIASKTDGTAFSAASGNAYLASAVPEPSSAGMAAIGILVLLCGCGRRVRRS